MVDDGADVTDQLFICIHGISNTFDINQELLLMKSLRDYNRQGFAYELWKGA